MADPLPLRAPGVPGGGGKAVIVQRPELDRAAAYRLLGRYVEVMGGRYYTGPDVGTVEACASCHRNHGTPYQWELAPTGKQAGRTCMTCHMALVTRPVAVGEEPRPVRSHVFPGSRSAIRI